MTRIRTTVWDLANAIIEEAERVASGPEAERLAAAALADLLDRARLVDVPEERPRARARAGIRYRRRFGGRISAAS